MHSMARKSRADYRDAVKLGDMLCLSRGTDEAKRERLLRFLAEFEETAVPLLINNRIKKYAEQTAVHIAAKYGFSACLEILLGHGGIYNTYVCSRNARVVIFSCTLLTLQVIRMQNRRQQISSRSVL